MQRQGKIGGLGGKDRVRDVQAAKKRLRSGGRDRAKAFKARKKLLLRS